MPGIAEEPTAEAQAALKSERRNGILRSLAIALGFGAPYSFIQQWVHPVVAWLGFGIPMGLAMAWLHGSLLGRLRHRSFVVTILRQSLAYGLTVAFSLCLSMFIVIAWQVMPQAPLSEAGRLWLQVVTNPWFLAALPAAMLLVLPIRFFFALNQKLGPGVLKKWMLGHYHDPREEQRIFMFLDMKDSTTLAEQLGNLRFSALVRDFFDDLTLPVLQTKAEVSHYIGDEAVLTWRVESGLARANCIRLFFEFEKAIAGRKSIYLERYGHVPAFKAGLHLGPVVATEVGQIKSEIVYHGDVLNTAARIQGLCATLGEDFLASAEIVDRIEWRGAYELVPKGEQVLKGKELPVALSGIRKPSSSPAPIERERSGSA